MRLPFMHTSTVRAIVEAHEKRTQESAQFRTHARKRVSRWVALCFALSVAIIAALVRLIA